MLSTEQIEAARAALSKQRKFRFDFPHVSRRQLLNLNALRAEQPSPARQRRGFARRAGQVQSATTAVARVDPRLLKKLRRPLRMKIASQATPGRSIRYGVSPR